MPNFRPMLKMVLATYLKNLVKIGSVIAELFLISTNVGRTNIAWTNVTFKVSSKSGQ